MPEVCPNCGLPKEICVCETIAIEEQKIKVATVNKRYGKKVTITRDGIGNSTRYEIMEVID